MQNHTLVWESRQQARYHPGPDQGQGTFIHSCSPHYSNSPFIRNRSGAGWSPRSQTRIHRWQQGWLSILIATCEPQCLSTHTTVTSTRNTTWYTQQYIHMRRWVHSQILHLHRMQWEILLYNALLCCSTEAWLREDECLVISVYSC